MKKMKRWFKDFFGVEEFNNLDIASITQAFNDPTVRGIWLSTCFEEVRRINLEVDRRLLSGTELAFTDLCARRKAYQDMLEAILSARRQVTQDVRPNPRPQAIVDLDRVTT